LVLLYLAFRAEDDGTRAFPSQGEILGATKVDASDLRKILRGLENARLLSTQHTAGRRNAYTVNLARLKELAYEPPKADPGVTVHSPEAIPRGESSPRGVRVHPRGGRQFTPEGGASSPDPSIDPSIDPPKEDPAADAAATVEGAR
jgi:hypothetical protein